MSIIIKSIREAYEALKRIRQPPAEPPAPPQGWIAWDEPEPAGIDIPKAMKMTSGEIHRNSVGPGIDDTNEGRS